MTEKICKRCGKCCKNCKYLIGNKKIKSCRIYKNRIGTRINADLICVHRLEQRNSDGTLENFEGCPYNERQNNT